MTEEQNEDGDPSPEQIAEWDREDAEFSAFIDAKVKAGWVWDNSCLKLTHPDDKEIWVMYDLLTREEVYSPKRAQQIGEDIEQRKRSGEL